MKVLKKEELTIEQKLGMTMCATLAHGEADIEYVLDKIRNHACGAVWVSPNAGFEEKIRRVREVADYPLIIVCDSEGGAEPNTIPQQIALTAAGARDEDAYAFGYATAAARRAGLLTDRDQAIDGRELQDMTDDALVAVAKRCCVYSRISPADKQRLVKIWQDRSLPVLVTGEGAEDVPALREAEIGCGMARSGAEIATSTADLVLTDDRFSTLVATVCAGRTVFINLRKTVGIRLAHLLSLILTALLALLLFGVSPLSPAALLWTGGVSSLLLTAALGREVAQHDTMKQAPRTKREGLFAHGVFSSAASGAVLCVLTLIAQYAAGVPAAAAMLTLGQTVLFLIARSTVPVPFTRLFHAPWAWFATVVSAALFLLPLTVPALGALLGLSALTADAWRTVGLLLAVLWLAAEVYKWVRFLLRAAVRRTESR